MLRSLVVAAVLLLSIRSAYAELTIHDIQFSEGLLGPQRKGDRYMLGEEIFMRFRVAGAVVDADSRCEVKLTFELKSQRGVPVSRQEGEMQVHSGPGNGNMLFVHSSITLPSYVAPGAYKVLAKVRDKRIDKETAFERDIDVVPQEFAIVSPRFFASKEENARQISSHL